MTRFTSASVKTTKKPPPTAQYVNLPTPQRLSRGRGNTVALARDAPGGEPPAQRVAIDVYREDNPFLKVSMSREIDGKWTTKPPPGSDAQQRACRHA